MALLIAALIISFVPSILMFLFIRNNRGDDEEYRKECLSLLGKGFLIALLVFLFDLIIKIVWNLTGIGENNLWIDRLFTCFVVNATVEELSKFLVARKSFLKDPTKTSRLDIISFLIISAVSFGLVEDLVYVLQTNIGQIIVRGLLMGHVPYAMLMGLLYSKGIAENKAVFKVLAFLFPILLHGSYNFLLSDGLPDWTGVVVVTEVFLETVFMIWMIFFMKKKRYDPAYTDPILNQ